MYFSGGVLAFDKRKGANKEIQGKWPQKKVY